MTKRGAFIAIEGLEGAGKSTALKVIQNVIAEHGFSYDLTREPGGTETGEAIRELIKRKTEYPLEAHVELMLMYASRLQLLLERIIPSLERGNWVLSDRFAWSSYAYQGGGRGIPITQIDALSAWVSESLSLSGKSQEYLTPDLIIYMDLNPEVGMQRVSSRGEEQDRIEAETMDFFHRVHQAYQYQVAHSTAVAVIDALQKPEAVAMQLTQCIQQFIRKFESDHG